MKINLVSVLSLASRTQVSVHGRVLGVERQHKAPQERQVLRVGSEFLLGQIFGQELRDNLRRKHSITLPRNLEQK